MVSAIVGKLYKKYSLFKLQRDKNKQKRLKKGVPEWITYQTLNDLCLRYLKDTLGEVHYLKLSSWKTFGAYRLILRTNKNYRWSLIYKNDIYRPEEIPALIGLPIAPGPPEYNIYKNAGKTLSKYIPYVYICQELIQKEDYKYVLEDIGPEYRKASGDTKSILNIVGQLSSIHEAMSKCEHAINNEYLFHYDYNYAKALDKYIWENYEKYQSVYFKRTGDESVAEVCKLRDKISELHLRSEFYEKQKFRLIHGDLNPSNVLIHENDSNRIKLIDWEWAGIGLAHFDLATLLQTSAPSVEQQALKIYQKNNSHLELKEHCRLYEFCKMERGLINAAYVIALNMEAPGKIRHTPGIIKRSMRNVLTAYNELAF
jgi:thiamine kinase-like enzyme